MSVDHSMIAESRDSRVFLRVAPGDVVIVWEHPEIVDIDSRAWWMGEVLFVEGSARDHKAPSLFQVSNIDTGEICFVNADQVQKILIPKSRTHAYFSSELA